MQSDTTHVELYHCKSKNDSTMHYYLHVCSNIYIYIYIYVYLCTLPLSFYLSIIADTNTEQGLKPCESEVHITKMIIIIILACQKEQWGL